MFSKIIRIVLGSSTLMLLTAPVYAQQKTAYETGLQVAQFRGVSNTTCYAQVFTKFAVHKKNADGSSGGWWAASTPAYNDAMRRQCGVDRVNLAKQQDLNVHKTTSGHNSAGAYQAGLEAGRRFGYKNPDCYARVFSRYATPTTSQSRPGIWYEYSATPAFLGELRRLCNI